MNMNSNNPLLFIARHYFLLPVNRALKISPFWHWFNATLIVILTLITLGFKFLLLANSEYAAMFGQGVNGYLFITQSILDNLCITSHLYKLVFRIKDLEKILEAIKELHKLRITYTNVFANCITLFGVSWPILAYAVIFWISGTTSLVQKIGFILSLCGQTGFFFIVMLFCSFLELIRCHFRELANDINRKTVQSQVEQHSFMKTLAKETNDFFTLQNLIACIRCSVNFVIYLFFWIEQIKVFSKDRDSLCYLFIWGGYALWEIAILYCLSASCSKTMNEAERFNKELFKLMRESRDLCSNDKLQLYVIVKDKNTFHACGFFTIGYPLITSVIAASTTYLVILVQFTMK